VNNQVRFTNNSGACREGIYSQRAQIDQIFGAARRMEKHFPGFTFCYIPRSENTKADELVKIAAQKSHNARKHFLSRANG
jgi:hypothetical protein